MRYQQIIIGVFLVFFVPVSFSAWTTNYGATSSDYYIIEQKKGGCQNYKLSFADDKALIVDFANSASVSLLSATSSNLNVAFKGHFYNVFQSSTRPHTFIIALIGVFAGSISYLDYLQQSRDSDTSLTMARLDYLSLTELSVDSNMNIKAKVVDNFKGKEVNIVSRIGEMYRSGELKTIQVNASQSDQQVVLEFEVFVPGCPEPFVEIALDDEKKDSGSSGRDDEEDPDAGCCGSLSGCTSALAGYIISCCCGTRSSETQPVYSSKGGYNTLQLKLQELTPQAEINSPLKMAIGADVLLRQSRFINH